MAAQQRWLTCVLSGKMYLLCLLQTTGLDAASSKQLVSLLKTAAENHGMLVVATLHQPSASIFERFDRCLVLSKGLTIYFGATLGARQFFSNAGAPCPPYHNPADFFLDVVNIDYADADFVAVDLEQGDRSVEMTIV